MQTAENLLAHGVIDGVVPLENLRPTLDRALRVLVDRRRTAGRRSGGADTGGAGVGVGDGLAPPGPPGVGWLLREGATDRVLLSGTHGEAAATVLALAPCFGGRPAVVVGQQRVVGAVVGPPPCGRRGAGWRWPPGCGCRWSW